jgi:hypothetical protein
MTRALLLILLVLCPVLAAAPDDQARRITGQPEYKGYRVERRTASPAPQPSADDGRSADGGTADGGRGSDGTPQRGGGATGPQRGGGSSGGGGGGGGSGLSAPGWLGPLFEVLAWGVLIVGGAVALFFIVKALLGIKWRKKAKAEKAKRKKTTKPAESQTEAPPDVETIDEQVFEDALAQARAEYARAIAAQDYAAATLLAYRIFWLRAGWQGCVEKSDVRTWRDALRMVRAAEVRGEVRSLLPMVERVRYADYKPHHGEFNTWNVLLEKIEPSGVLK